MRLSYVKQPEFQELDQDFWSKDAFLHNRRLFDDILSGRISGNFTTKDFKGLIDEFAFQKIIQTKPPTEELKTGYFKNKEVIKNWWDTFAKLGISQSKSSGDLTKEQERVYVEWLGRKLLIPHEEYEGMNHQDIDALMSTYLNEAINITTTFHGNIQNRSGLQSSFYEQIHNSKNIYELLQKFFKYSKKMRDNKRKGHNNPTNERDLNMAMYEVIRILALLRNILLWHQSHTNHTIKSDIEFLARKFGSLISNKPTSWQDDLSADNPLYGMTRSSTVYWGKNKNGAYSTNTDTTIGYHNNNDDDVHGSFMVEGATISGKLGEGDTRIHHINLLHVNLRGAKNVNRGILKRERKGFSSYEELLDKKGFQFVVSTEKEKDTLIQMLAHELGTGMSSWIEPPEMGSNNKDSDRSFNVRKGTLAVYHKLKNVQEGLQRAKLNRRIKKDRKTSQVVTDILDRASYNFPLEIQVFTMDEFISAEHDTTSEAHHQKYEQKQLSGMIHMLYPRSIYGKEQLVLALRDRIKCEQAIILNGIKNVVPSNS